MESRQQRQLEVSRSTLRESKNRRQKMEKESCAGHGGGRQKKGIFVPRQSRFRREWIFRSSRVLFCGRSRRILVIASDSKSCVSGTLMGTLPVAGSFLCRLVNFDCSLLSSRKDEKQSDRIIFCFNICCKIMLMGIQFNCL